ncbi:MAG: RAMP superfamily CRISPR-associated protein [Lachnospiraceae bacterium]|nr:RAMP superfamily CRISPR-associated protein [Lachnospiraceae bacterium]
MANKFINPYHFVPLAQNRRSCGESEGELLTGKIRVRIETRTPLFIPNTANDKAFHDADNRAKNAPGSKDHKSYDFFSYTQKNGDLTNEYFEPVIPGSEVRGMIRNIYETVTGSCMSAIDDDVQIVKRVGDPYRPGLIRREADGSMTLISSRRDRLWPDEIRRVGGWKRAKGSAIGLSSVRLQISAAT